MQQEDGPETKRRSHPLRYERLFFPTPARWRWAWSLRSSPWVAKTTPSSDLRV